MNTSRITVKIGSNVLTRPDGTLDITRMSALVDQVAALHRQGVQIIMVSSGAVASGRSELKGKLASGHMDPVSARQLFSAVGQAKLINKYYELFRDHGISCGQVLTTKENFSTRRQYLNQKNCMEVMLEEGVIPIVNENDTISVTELMFTDNDELSGMIATMMNARILVLLSNIDGIYTGNPTDPQAQLIPIIDSRTDIADYIQESKSVFGRGGMVTKHRIARKVASEGIEVVIANGRRDNILLELITFENNKGKCGINNTCRCTRFCADNHPTSNIKKWIAHSRDFSKGIITLNAGAVAALCGREATSILPIGIVRITGDFEEDDIVKIADETGKTLGVGKTSVNSQIALTQLGKKGMKPIIHYDYLWLEEE